MVAGLVATVAIPAYAATMPAAETMTLQQMSAADNQSLVVASDASAETLDRSSYSATTAEEIQKKKDEEAAAARPPPPPSAHVRRRRPPAPPSPRWTSP